MIEARLEVTDVLGRRIVTIEKTPFLVGRRAGSDLHLPSAEVSRDHVKIVASGDGYAISDRGSRYGTFVNDEEVRRQALAHGDRIRLGRSGGAELVFRLSDDADQPTDRAAPAPSATCGRSPHSSKGSGHSARPGYSMTCSTSSWTRPSP
jgi:pSer/pThr/pTyr-binding forkhead associated (FHA) protein